MGSPPTLDPRPTWPPDPHRQADAGDSELLEHLQTPVAFGGHEFGDWPVDQIAGGFGDDLDARHRHDHTRLATEFPHTRPELSRDPVREGERAFDRLNPDYGVPADQHSHYGRQAVREREAALALGSGWPCTTAAKRPQPGHLAARSGLPHGRRPPRRPHPTHPHPLGPGAAGPRTLNQHEQGAPVMAADNHTTIVVGCVGCGVRATPHGRRLVRVRDLPIGGRPVVLWWRKRIWPCREPACRVRTWTERVAGIAPRAVLTQRARAEACRRVGKDAHAVAAVARDLGVGWATIMRAVGDHGRPLVEDPGRLDGVAALGLDETSFLKATRRAPTRYVTGLVDLERGRLLDVVADRTKAAVDGWLGARPGAWLARIGTVALDPWRGYASALVAPLGHATVVVDHVTTSTPSRRCVTTPELGE